jgi:hypothetical protein
MAARGHSGTRGWQQDPVLHNSDSANNEACWQHKKVGHTPLQLPANDCSHSHQRYALSTDLQYETDCSIACLVGLQIGPKQQFSWHSRAGGERHSIKADPAMQQPMSAVGQ